MLQGRYEPQRGPVLANLLMMTRSMAFNRIEQRRNLWQLVQRWSHQLFPSAVRSPQEAAEADDRSRQGRKPISTSPSASSTPAAAAHSPPPAARCW